MPFCNAPDCPVVDLKVGDVVHDCLTSGGPQGIVSTATVLEIWEEVQKDFRVFGLKLDNPYLEGLRHPWEISLVDDTE
jgi:hypothetical protein